MGGRDSTFACNKKRKNYVFFICRLLRPVVFEIALKANHQGSKDKVKELFDKWINNDIAVSPDMKDIVYRYGVKQGSKEDWNKVWDKFAAELDANEKAKLMAAIAQSQDTTILTE